MGKYSLERLPYPSDVTDEEWALFDPLIPAEKPGGRPQSIPRREIVNAMLYVLRSGCPWRMIPHDLPRWFTAYASFRRWKRQGVWEQVNAALRRDLRVAIGREAEPSVAILDSQSVKTSAVRGDARGTDGWKKIWGRKRHLLVDTLGLLLAVRVCAVNIHDQFGARMILAVLRGQVPRLQVIWGDHSYQGPFQAWVAEHLEGVQVEIVSSQQVAPTAGAGVEGGDLTGKKPRSRRWVVERTHAWVTHARRLARDYEGTNTSSEALISLAMSKLTVARLARIRS